MAKYIDANLVLKGIKELKKSPWANSPELCPLNVAIKEALETVEQLCIMNEPIADVEPIKHGCWVVQDWNTVVCSVCDSYWISESATRDFIENSNYCPNCGAKMDGDDKI